MLDRLLHHSHIIKIQGKSYRLKNTKKVSILEEEFLKREKIKKNGSILNRC